jgi:molecular chaperone GrpE (heat shock protein)
MDDALDRTESTDTVLESEHRALEASTAAPQDPPLGGSLEAVEGRIARGFQTVLDAFERKLAFDQHKESQIDRMHEELQRHRSSLLTQAMRPLIGGIIRTHDDTNKIAQALGRKDPAELTPERVAKVLAGLCEDLELVLEQNGVTVFREHGDEFDPRRQQAIRKVSTANAVSAGKVAERIHVGFELDGMLLQKERVSVYILSADPEAPGDSADTSASGAQSTVA